MLECFRDGHDSLLLDQSLALFNVLSVTGVRFLSAGRLKRTKSIIRKLQRPENKGMDLSRIGDLVGLRIIVKNTEDQEIFDGILRERWPDAYRSDYRDRDNQYRAVHYLISEGGKRIEVQIRTIVQHLWAEESETFGEKVKEGGGTVEIRDYLDKLAYQCHTVEMESKSWEALYPGGLYMERNPGYKLTVLSDRFEDATQKDLKAANSYVVVFDSATKELTQIFSFNPRERSESLVVFHRLSRTLPEDRYDVLVFNTANDRVIGVTHSRYFAF